MINSCFINIWKLTLINSYKNIKEIENIKNEKEIDINKINEKVKKQENSIENLINNDIKIINDKIDEINNNKIKEKEIIIEEMNQKMIEKVNNIDLLNSGLSTIKEKEEENKLSTILDLDENRSSNTIVKSYKNKDEKKSSTNVESEENKDENKSNSLYENIDNNNAKTDTEKKGSNELSDEKKLEIVKSILGEDDEERKKKIGLFKRTSVETIDLNALLKATMGKLDPTYKNKNNNEDDEKDDEKKEDIKEEEKSKEELRPSLPISTRPPKEMRRIKTDGNLSNAVENRKDKILKRLNKGRQLQKKNEAKNKYRKSLVITMQADILGAKLGGQKEEKEEKEEKEDKKDE